MGANVGIRFQILPAVRAREGKLGAAMGTHQGIGIEGIAAIGA